MKNHFFSALSLAFLCSISIDALSQVKVFQNEDVQIGPVWGGAPGYNLFVNGNAHYNCYPAQFGGFYFKNYPNGTYNEPIILPNVSHNMWLGNDSSRLWRAYVHSVYTINGGVLSYSDSRMKENVVTLKSDESLGKVLQINCYKYDFKRDAFSNTPDDLLERAIDESKDQLGVMAQELVKVVPEAVSFDEENDVYSVNYTSLIPLLVESVKAQNRRIEALENTPNFQHDEK